MDALVKSLRVVIKNRDSRRILIGSSLFFFVAAVLIEKSSTIFSLITLDFTSPQRVAFVFTYIFDLKSSFTTGGLTLVIIGSILGGINITFAYAYFKNRAKVLTKTNAYSGAGLFLAFLGVGCAACGTALLSTLLGFLGLSSLLGILPYQGLEVGYIGLAVLMLATISLAKKVIAPNIC